MKLTSSAISSINNYVISTCRIIPAFKKLVSPFPLPTYIFCHIEHKRRIACPLLVAEVVRLHLKKYNSALNVFSATCHQRHKGTRSEVLLQDTNRLDSHTKISAFREIWKKDIWRVQRLMAKVIKIFTFFVTRVKQTNKY